MKQDTYKTITIDELTNIDDIVNMCKDNNNPIIITNNDNEEIVMMSIKTYEELYIKIKTSVLINESLENNTKDFIDGKEFFDLMRIKYEV